MEAFVTYDGEYFLCRYFFDIDEQAEGIEVYYISNNTLVGIIDGISLPDEDDIEEVEQFDKTVIEWLAKQDANYLLG